MSTHAHGPFLLSYLKKRFSCFIALSNCLAGNTKFFTGFILAS